MSKILAIIDLDTNRDRGQSENLMVVDNSDRSRLAREYADQFSQREQTSAYFAKLFDPDLMQYDIIELEARKQIELIEKRGATVVFLTSRPHIMQTATEQWLTANGISRPCHFKNYGTGEVGPDGKRRDTGDRYMKTPAWKAREVTRIVNQVETEQGEPLTWILFADDEEANRAAVAELDDPRILIRCSLSDAATHDFQRYDVGQDQEKPAFLRRLLELAMILEQREAFETTDQVSITIKRPQIPDEKQAQHTSVLIESWNEKDSGRRYRYTEYYPQRNELSEIEHIPMMQVACGESGRVNVVRMAKAGPALSLLELEDMYADDPEKAQLYADEWTAHSIEEFGYVEVARAQRGMQIIGQPALDAYLAHVQTKNEELTAALKGGSAQ